MPAKCRNRRIQVKPKATEKKSKIPAKRRTEWMIHRKLEIIKHPKYLLYAGTLIDFFICFSVYNTK